MNKEQIARAKTEGKNPFKVTRKSTNEDRYTLANDMAHLESRFTGGTSLFIFTEVTWAEFDEHYTPMKEV